MWRLAELAYFTDDVAGMAEFYRRLLGVAPVGESEGMVIFQVGDASIFIHEKYAPAEGELPPENHVAFAVDDVDAACQALQERGLALELAPRSYYWGRSAYLRDPGGRLIELTEPAGVERAGG